LFIADGDLNVRISPALFVPLVENCFKFASFKNQKPSVNINLSSENGIINFDISNYFDNSFKLNEPAHSGFGIINLRKRLDLAYPGKYSLLIDPEGSLFHVKLTIDTNAD
jgi:sensor histidine kinase YesM